MKSISLILSLLLLLSCESKTTSSGKSIEVFDYYEDGTVKSIANYKGGNPQDHRHRDQPGEFEILQTADYYDVQQLMDSLKIPFDMRLQGMGYLAAFDEAGFQRTSTQVFRINELRLMSEIQLVWAEPTEDDRTYKLWAVRVPDKRDLHVSNKDNASVEKKDDPGSGRLTLSLKLTDEGAADFQEMTENNVDRYLAMVFDGVVLSAPKVMGVIAGGHVEISGSFTDSQLTLLVNLISQRMLNGEYREYHPNGKLKAIRQFENGVQLGRAKKFDQNGNPI